MDDADELITEFLIESAENLDRLDREFVELERDPSSPDVLASIFRTIHTIKGTAGFLGLEHLGALSHAGESLLSRLRDGQLVLDTDITNALLAMVDEIRGLLTRIESTGSDEGADHSALIARLTELLDAPPGAATEQVEAGPSDATPDATPATPNAVDTAAAPSPLVDSPATEGPTSGSTTAESSIRVDVHLLDQLMNLVGELVLTRNQILQYQGAPSDATFVTTSQQLDLITTELQEGVMKTRMQPIGNVWSKMPRIVRDLAVTCSKSVELEMDGAETELDKSILEAIKDPLTHIVRNAVDHGLESPEERRAAGKPEVGTIRLRSRHEGGQVIIEVSDDGAGVNVERVRARALERGLVTHDQLERMSPREVAGLVFLPGFSTAEQVTSLSGRGVGMDVVRTNIGKIGGTVDLHSERGRGTTIIVKIPLTLAIIPALVVTCRGQRYAIPQVNLVELLRLDLEDGSAIEYVAGAPVHRLRGRLLPVLDLAELLGQESDQADPSTANLVVLQADDHCFGLLVDGINDTEEIVVKPLAPQLKSSRAFAGTTIMGDGSVALILDTIGLAQIGSVLGEQRERAVTDDGDGQTDRRSDTVTVIVCSVGDRRLAVPLALVDRLEEFAPEVVEPAAGRDVVQYRDQLLTLVPLDRALDIASEPVGSPSPRTLQVLVHTNERGVFGLVVDEIIDILETDPTQRHDAPIPGVDYSGIVGRRVTDVIDLDEIIRSVTRPAAELAGVGGAGRG